MRDWFGKSQGLVPPGNTLEIYIHLAEPLLVPFWSQLGGNGNDVSGERYLAVTSSSMQFCLVQGEWQALGVGDGRGGLVCCSPWGWKELDTTERRYRLTEGEWRCFIEKAWSSEFQQVRVQITPLSISTCMIACKLSSLGISIKSTWEKCGALSRIISVLDSVNIFIDIKLQLY